MRYRVDHDLHLHTHLSACSSDVNMTPERILSYAEEEGYHTVAVTDHFWDERVAGASRWYAPQNFAHVCESLPLPQKKTVRFLFGAETEMRYDGLLGLSEERIGDFAFIIVPVGHFHSVGFALTQEDAATPRGRAERFFFKLEALLARPLPFEKMGLAHAVYSAMAPKGEYLPFLAELSSPRWRELMARCAAVGLGIELNTDCLSFSSEEEQTAVLSLYHQAKKEGCRFYFGSDAHGVSDLVGKRAVAEEIVSALGLVEEDKLPLLQA